MHVLRAAGDDRYNDPRTWTEDYLGNWQICYDIRPTGISPIISSDINNHLYVSNEIAIRFHNIRDDDINNDDGGDNNHVTITNDTQVLDTDNNDASDNDNTDVNTLPTNAKENGIDMKQSLPI